MEKEQKTMWIIFVIVAMILIFMVGYYSCNYCFGPNESQNSKEKNSSNTNISPPPAPK